MIPPDEVRHLRHGPAAGETAGGAGLVRVDLVTSTDPTEVLRRATEVVLAVLAVPTEAWRDRDRIVGALPSWFLDGCAPEPDPEELRRWLAWWQALTPAEQARVEAEQPWSVGDWLHWMDPDERGWFWWDGQVTGDRSAHVSIEVPGWPTPLGALDWLLRVSGAVRTRSAEPGL